MRRLAFVVVVVCLMALVASSARAADTTYNFPVCGTVINRNTSHQFGPFNWLEYIVETQGVFDICGQWVVTAAADVSGVPKSAITVDGIMSADVLPQQGRSRQQQCLDVGGTWNGVSCSIPNCPLIIDTAGDGFRLTSVE